MRTCSNRVRYSAEALRGLSEPAGVDRSRREEIKRFNDQAGRRSGSIQCHGCGQTLKPCITDLPSRSEQARGEGPVFYFKCEPCERTTLAEEQWASVAAAQRQMLDQARGLGEIRQRERNHLASLGRAVARTAFFRLYKPTTPSQQRALAVVKSYAGVPWCLLLSGDPGVGKSMLAGAKFRHATRKALRQSRPLPAWVTEDEMAKEWRAAFSGGPGAADAMLTRYMNAPLLFVDELGLVSATATGWIAAMGQLLNYRHREQLETVITTNLNAKEIAQMYSPRVMSRLAEGECVKVEGADWRRSKAA
jgi:DNA replication protein DnaC